MFFKKNTELFMFCFILQASNAAIEMLKGIDSSITQQIECPDTSPKGIAQLLGNLKNYKQNLYKLTITFAQTTASEEFRRDISQMRNTGFLAKVLDFNNLKQSFNLSERIVKVLGTEIKGILMNWKQLNLVIAINPPFKDSPKYLPFHLFEDSGKRLTFILDHALPSKSQEMFIEFCAYYYALGKIIKLLKMDDETSMVRSENMYKEEKPIFLQKFLGIRQIMHKMGLSDSERSDLDIWIKKIYVRWFKFINVYKKKMNISNEPNLNNLEILNKTDVNLVKLLTGNNNNCSHELIEGVKTFNKYLRLIMRRNYPCRTEVIKAARNYYKTEDPLFLRQMPNITVLQTYVNMNIKSISTMQYLIDQIKFKWSFLVGLQKEVNIPKRRGKNK